MPVDWGIAPGGGPWVTDPGPAGSTTVILTSVTPSIALIAARAWRTSVAGSARPSRKVKVTRPSTTVRSRIIPADMRSLSSRGFLIDDSAAATLALTVSVTGTSDGLNRLHFGNRLAEPDLDPLAKRDGGCGAPLAGPAESENEQAFVLVEVDHLDRAPVGGDVWSKRVQGPFDSFQQIHGRNI